MLTRIVRMTFQADKISEFLNIFEQSKQKIRDVQGCTFLELLQDLDTANVFITRSHWNSVEDLNHYRHSELFRTTWDKTKILFAERPLAFSSQVVSKT